MHLCFSLPLVVHRSSVPLRVQYHRPGLRLVRNAARILFSTKSCTSASETQSNRLENTRAKEMEQARKEARPYRIDVSKLTAQEREQLRLRSRAIELVADKEPLDIVYEDVDFLVVNKPGFLKMHPSHRFEGGSLLNRAIGYLGYPPYLLHRLDMHTTGVVMMAKRKELCRPIMDSFMNGEVDKKYLCVVDGYRDEELQGSFSVDAPIQRHEVKFMREVGDSNADSKPAETLYTIMDKSCDKRMMLLSAKPRTGRTHQIRLHAKKCSLPIVGDDLYNPREHDLYDCYEAISAAARDKSLVKYGDNNPLRKGLKLHAWKIEVDNPVDGKRISFCAPPPTHMSALLEWAGMEAPGSE